MTLFDDPGMQLVSNDNDCMDDLYDLQPTERSDRSPPLAIAPPLANTIPITKPRSLPATEPPVPSKKPVTSNKIGASKYLRRKDPCVIQQGELWEIEQGFVKALTWDEQGCVLTQGIWGPGDFVGLPLGHITPYEILCMSTVQVKVHTLANGYPYEFLWDQAQQSQELLSLFRCRCVENRLLDALWWLAKRFGTSKSGGRLTGITLTHQELADLVGSTRVTITRMLRQLETSGKLERVNRQFLLKDSTHNPQMRGDCL